MISDIGKTTSRYKLFLRGESNYRRLGTNDNASTSEAISSSSPYPPDWLIFTICFSVWFIAALTIRICCMQFLSNKFEPCHEREFDCAISEAEAKTHRRRIQQQKKKKRNNLQIAHRPEKQEASALAYTTFEFYDGDFLLTYTDASHQTKTGFARLTLKNNGSGYTVSGMCADSGSAHIQDGFCAYSGEAWWVASSHETDGLRVLSTGQFNFGTNRFQGTWRDNKGSRGKYIRFESTRVFVSSSTETPAETSVLTSEENIRRGSSIFVGNTTEYGEA